MAKNIFLKIKEELPQIQKGILLKDYTTFKIGGPAKYFFVTKTKDDLIKAIKVSKKFELPFFILGGGSNVLFSDKSFNGMVIKLQMGGIEINKNNVYAAAGVMLPKLANIIFKNNFTGFEWATGVPGTVGGAIYGNAQAFGTKISDAINNVEVLNSKTLKVENFSKEKCKFSLKNSIFKRNKNLIILSVILNFKKGDEKEIKEKIHKFLKHRKKCHPIEFPSAGSIFVNPEIQIKNKKLLEKYPELNELNKCGIIPSGYFIEKSGLRGKKIGGAQISEKHANFIINLGDAKAKDVLALINLAQKKVKDTFNVKIETEIQCIGFNKK